MFLVFHFGTNEKIKSWSNYLTNMRATLSKTSSSKSELMLSTKVAFLAFKSIDFRCSQSIKPVVEV